MEPADLGSDDGGGDCGGEPVHCSGRLLEKIDSLAS